MNGINLNTITIFDNFEIFDLSWEKGGKISFEKFRFLKINRLEVTGM